MSCAHAGELGVGQRAGAAARGRLGLDDPHRKPALAQITAAANPLGPLPTTVTSTGTIHRSPLGWPGELCPLY